MNKPFKLNTKVIIILIIAAVITIIYINESHIRRYLDSFTAEEPKEHLAKGELAIERHDVEQSMSEIDMAIKSLSIVEDYTDSTANKFIEKSIKELEKLKIEIKQGDIISEDFKLAYFDAFSSMAYANMRLSELELQDGSHDRAVEHFENSLEFLKISMKYATEPKKDKELALIKKINGILETLKTHENLEDYNFKSINGDMENLMK